MRGAQSSSWRSRDAEPCWDGLAACPTHSQLSFVVFSPLSHFCKRNSSHHAFFFPPGFLPLSPWRSSSFICVRKSKQSTSLLRRWGVLSKKLTRDIPEPWPREGNKPHKKPHKNPFSGKLCCASQGSKRGWSQQGCHRGGQKVTNSACGIRHRAGAAEKRCIWTATAIPVKKHPGNLGINFS